VALALPACGDDDTAEGGGDGATTTTTDAVETTTTTTEAETGTTTTSAPERVERPPLATTGENLVNVFASLQAYKGTLFTDPDPELLEDVVLFGTPYYNELLERITTLTDNGYRLSRPELSYADVQVTQRPPEDPNVALVSAIESNGGTELLDAQGAVVDTSEGREDVRVIFTLRRSDDTRWRLEAAQVLGPA
jgi:hypothetical protein